MSIDHKIKIFDEEYALRNNLSDNPEHLERVAAYVDRKMWETASNYVNLSAKHVAVLAALNIAEECLALQEKCFAEFKDGSLPRAADDAVPRLKGLNERVLSVLKDAAPSGRGKAS